MLNMDLMRADDDELEIFGTAVEIGVAADAEFAENENEN